MVMSFVLTFTDWSLMGTKHFIGLENWRRLLTDADVWNSLKVTLLYALYVVIPVVIIGLILALIINQKRRGVGILQGLIFPGSDVQHRIGEHLEVAVRRQ